MYEKIRKDNDDIHFDLFCNMLELYLPPNPGIIYYAIYR